MHDPQTQWIAAMRRNDHEAAWAVSDAVLAARDPAARDDPALPYHRRFVWDGRPFDGRHVLVRCYHGLGDTLQFARYLPPLAARAASVTLEAQAPLLPLLETLPGIARARPFLPHAPAPPAECDLEIMELAHALRLPPQRVPPPELPVRPIPAPPGAIGLCWQSGGWDAARAIPYARLAPALPRHRPRVALQPGPAPAGFRNPAGAPAALADTAALVAGLSLVITVDTMAAHLAGTLGVPTLLLLKHDADWRWGAHTDRSPWYPSLRLLRQTTPGDWSAVAASLAAILSADSPPAPAHRPDTAPPGSSSPARYRSAASDPAACPAAAPARP
jgi:hypothetical protein